MERRRKKMKKFNVKSEQRNEEHVKMSIKCKKNVLKVEEKSKRNM